MKKNILVFTCLICLFGKVNAILELQLTKGVFKRIPMGIAYVGQLQDANDIVDIVESDMKISGEISTQITNNKFAADVFDEKEIVFPEKIDYFLAANFTKIDGNIVVRFKLFYVHGKKKLLLDKQLTIQHNQIRKLGHYISDLLYEQITGDKGIFSTKIAFVKRNLMSDKTLSYRLMVADYDGYNEEPLLSSKEPIMSISWAPQGNILAFVSFERGRAEIYTIELTTGKRTLITSFTGLNGAPKFSPDGSKLAVVLSKYGEPDLFIYELESHTLRRITKGSSIDTEPEWSGDSNFIYFTSDRHNGRINIHRVEIASLDVTRLTGGTYSASPQVIPNSNKLLMLHRTDYGFNIAVQNMDTKAVEILTNSGHIQNPSVAPNGKMVLFSFGQNGNKVLKILPLSGLGSYKLKIKGRDILKPAWGPIT